MLIDSKDRFTELAGLEEFKVLMSKGRNNISWSESYADMVTSVDEIIGKVVKKIEEVVSKIMITPLKDFNKLFFWDNLLINLVASRLAWELIFKKGDAIKGEITSFQYNEGSFLFVYTYEKSTFWLEEWQKGELPKEMMIHHPSSDIVITHYKIEDNGVSVTARIYASKGNEFFIHPGSFEEAVQEGSSWK